MNEYIKSLRKKIGHDLIIQCGASVIVLNEQNEILLQLRKDNSCWGYARRWNPMNRGRGQRELYEETDSLQTSWSFSVFSVDLHYIYPNGDEVSNVDIVYLCKDYSGELKCQDSEVSVYAFSLWIDCGEFISARKKAILRFAEEFLTRNK